MFSCFNNFNLVITGANAVVVNEKTKEQSLLASLEVFGIAHVLSQVLVNDEDFKMLTTVFVRYQQLHILHYKAI